MNIFKVSLHLHVPNVLTFQSFAAPAFSRCDDSFFLLSLHLPALPRLLTAGCQQARVASHTARKAPHRPKCIWLTNHGINPMFLAPASHSCSHLRMPHTSSLQAHSACNTLRKSRVCFTIISGVSAAALQFEDPNSNRSEPNKFDHPRIHTNTNDPNILELHDQPI